MHSKVESIKIIEQTVEDSRKQFKRYELQVDGCARAAVEEQRNGAVRFRFYPVGAFDWQEAQVWLQGLLELSLIANELEWNNAKKKR